MYLRRHALTKQACRLHGASLPACGACIITMSDWSLPTLRLYLLFLFVLISWQYIKPQGLCHLHATGRTLMQPKFTTCFETIYWQMWEPGERSRNSDCGTAWTIWSSNPARGMEFFLFQIVQTSSGALPATVEWKPRFFSGVKVAGAWFLPPISM